MHWTWTESEQEDTSRRGVLSYQAPDAKEPGLELVVRKLSDGSTLGIWMVAPVGEPLTVIRAACC